jgi:hypothetical protein
MDHSAGPTIGGVHVRRAILLFALVLGLAARAAAISPSRNTGPPTPALAPPAGQQSAGGATRQLTFAVGGKPVRRAREGEHVVVSVASEAGGVATIPRLGLTASVSPTAPALFDLLAPAPGRYEVMITASEATEPKRVGTLVTRP